MGKSHKDLIAWKKGLALANRVYVFTRSFPKEELFGLSHQMRKAAVSIPSNLAGGSARATKKEFAQFVRIARGSAAEVETQVMIAMEQKMGDEAMAKSLLQDAEEVGRILTGLTQSLD